MKFCNCFSFKLGAQLKRKRGRTNKSIATDIFFITSLQFNKHNLSAIISQALECLLFGAGNDFVLQVPAHIYEVIAVTGHPDDKVAMLLGILLGFTLRLGVNNVELNMMAVELEVRSNQVGKFVNTVTSKHLRIEFHIQQGTSCPGVVNSGS